MSSTSFLPHSEGFEDQDNSARHPECPDDSNSLFAASGNFQAHHFPFAEDLGQMEYTPSMEPTGFSLNPEECQYAGGNDFNHGDALMHVDTQSEYPLMHEELMYPGTVSNFAAQSEPNFQPCPSIAINLEHTGTGIVVDDFSQLTTAREGSGNFDNAYDFCFHPEQLLPECNQDHVFAAPMGPSPNELGSYTPLLNVEQDASSFLMDVDTVPDPNLLPMASVDNPSLGDNQAMSTWDFPLDLFAEAPHEDWMNQNTEFSGTIFQQPNDSLGFDPNYTYYSSSRASNDASMIEGALEKDVTLSVERATDASSSVPDMDRTTKPSNSTTDSTTTKEVSEQRGPTTGRFRSLPKRKRGGRRGPLSLTQLEQLKQAKENGICIRCRRTKQKCFGGIPCYHCRENANATFWKKPCTKAEFLDIIKEGSFFPYASMFQAVKIQSEDALSMKAQMSIMKYLADRYAVIAVRSCMKYAPIDLKLLIPWMYGFTTVSYTFFDNSGELRAPSALRIAEATEKLAVLDKNCVVISSFTDNENIKHGNLFEAVLLFCELAPHEVEVPLDGAIGSLSDESKGRVMKRAAELTAFFAIRRIEIMLFRYLQISSNELNGSNTGQQHTFIGRVFRTLLECSHSNRARIKHLGIHAKDAAIESAVTEHADRVSRVRTALWVYASVAISKLPAWSDFWQKMQSTNPLLTREVILWGFRDSVRDFDSTFENVSKHVPGSFIKALEFRDAMNLVDPEIFSDNRGEKPAEGMSQLIMHSYVTGNLDELISKYDKPVTDGLLFANTKEKQTQAFKARFELLASIDWISCFPGTGEGASRDGGEYVILAMLAHNRMFAMESYQLARKIAGGNSGPAVSYADFTDLVIRHLERFTPKDSAEGFPHSYVERVLQQGRRWSEIQDLLGIEEVVLLGGRFEIFPQQEPTTKLDIPKIISDGNEDDFERLKRLLSTRLWWLSHYCSRLRGVLRMIIMAVALRKTDSEKAVGLGKQIAKRVTNAFGSAAFDCEVEPSQLRIIEQFNTIFRALGCMLWKWDESHDRDDHGADAEERDEKSSFYRIAIKNFVRTSTAFYMQPSGKTTEDSFKSIVHQAEEALQQAKDEFILKQSKGDSGSAESDESRRDGFTKEFLLSEAVNTFVRAISEFDRAFQKGGGEVRKEELWKLIEALLEKSAKAFGLALR